jgi:hypothetical protein
MAAPQAEKSLSTRDELSSLISFTDVTGVRIPVGMPGPFPAGARAGPLAVYFIVSLQPAVNMVADIGPQVVGSLRYFKIVIAQEI